MRAFIILCFIAAVSANGSGYGYSRPTLPGSSLIGGGGVGGVGAVGVSGGDGGGGVGVGGIGIGSLGGIGGGGGVGVGGIGGGSHHVSSGGVSGGGHHHSVHRAPQISTELHKEFFTFSAPEEEFAEPQVDQQISQITKKNVQVVFIRAPEQRVLQNAIQNLAQHTLEQQTAIYVLSKQPDLSHVVQSFQNTPNHVLHRPEVHFVKYRTLEDAQRAQQSIRAQYDSLGGDSTLSDGGVAPVLNFASPAVGHHGASGSGQLSLPIGSSGHIQAPSQSYLPVSL